MLFDPQFHVFDFSTRKGGLTKFLLVEENKLSQAPFIDIRFEAFAAGNFSIPTDRLFSIEDQHDIVRPQPVYIFHHAFVCSTLLARCLNQVDAFFSLKEPWIFRRLADFKRSSGNKMSPERWRSTFVNYNQLLAKNYLSGRIPVIKATNVANNLLVDVLRYMPESKVLYLYSDLESFLISNLKKTADTQKKMAGLLAGFLLDNDFGEKYSAGLNIGKLSFLQICSLVWVVNLYSLQRAVGEVGAANVRTLDMATLLDDLPKTVSEVSRYFGHKSNAQELSSMMAPQVVSTHAKDQSQRFDVNLRGKEALIILDRFGREVTSVKQWIQPLIDELDLTSSIASRALMIGGSPSTGEVLC
ncbi:MAG: hypothetical protein QMC00_03775 [Pseudomonadales bacterium]